MLAVSAKNIAVSKQGHTCLVVGVYEEGSLTTAAQDLDRLLQKSISAILKQGHFQAKIGQTLPIFSLDGHDVQIIVVGCGKKEPLTRAKFRQVVASSAQALMAQRFTHSINYLCELEIKGMDLVGKVQQAGLVALETSYVFDAFKSKKEPRLEQHMTIHVDQTASLPACELALQQASAIADGMALAKDLANMPSNVCTPSYLAAEAKKLTETYDKIAINVFDRQGIAKLKMGALLAVAQGSHEEPRLICLQYQGADKQTPPIALVGKGITFDTGGISLKQPDSQVGMKYDMCGAATVLGTIKAAARLKLPLNIVGVIPATENMPGGGAYKPEDILTSLAGITIEVLSTDAEGRLVLADALTYCIQQYKPNVVIDIATLTGAVVVALGTHTSGLLSNDQPLANALLQAGDDIYDRACQLPLYEEYQEQINTPFADIANLGGKSAGSITAACFLSRFTESVKWAHLDVAGTAALMFGTQERKATGRPIPLLMQYLISLTKE